MGLIESTDKFGRKRKRAFNILAASFMLTGVGLTGAVFALASAGEAFEGMCGDTIRSQPRSPNGSYIAYVFKRDCGAITSAAEIVPIVMLRERAHPVELKDNRIVFRYDWLGRTIDDVVYAGDFDDLKWLSNSHLQIQLSSESPGKGQASWNGVKISYSQPQPKGN